MRKPSSQSNSARAACAGTQTAPGRLADVAGQAPRRAGRLLRLAAPLALSVLALAACTATQPPVTPGQHLPGFWFGLWQGFIAPITFIVSLFTGDLRIYAFPNAGLWYDFGFMLGISGFSGGIFTGFRRRR
jgi:hypothetical protein